jgi:hypothetical protein
LDKLKNSENKILKRFLKKANLASQGVEVVFDRALKHFEDKGFKGEDLVTLSVAYLESVLQLVSEGVRDDGDEGDDGPEEPIYDVLEVPSWDLGEPEEDEDEEPRSPQKRWII